MTPFQLAQGGCGAPRAGDVESLQCVGPEPGRIAIPRIQRHPRHRRAVGAFGDPFLKRCRQQRCLAEPGRS